jgi:hypothetical protein
MHVSLRIPRNRKIPNRVVVGTLDLVLKWPGGSTSYPIADNFSSAIRHFRQRLHLVPLEQRAASTADISCAVRKARGGVRRVILARWTAREQLPEFFRIARLAYARLPKEEDDEHKMISHEIRDN